MQHVVIFGGAFDPPHLGHELVIKQALKQLDPDQLWLMPCYGHTFSKMMAPVNHRLKMAEFLSKTVADKRVKASDFEIVQKASGSTYETWVKLNRLYPKTKFSFLMGSDNLAKFTKWQHWEELITRMQFYVYIRKGYPARPWFERMKLLDSPEISEVSSTQIRDRLSDGREIKDLVPETVAKYIKAVKLYC